MSQHIFVLRVVDYLAEYLLNSLKGIDREDVEIARLRAMEQVLGIDLSAFQTAIQLRDVQDDGDAQEFDELREGDSVIYTDGETGEVRGLLVDVCNGQRVQVLVTGDSPKKVDELIEALHDAIDYRNGPTLH